MFLYFRCCIFAIWSSGQWVVWVCGSVGKEDQQTCVHLCKATYLIKHSTNTVRFQGCEPQRTELRKYQSNSWIQLFLLFQFKFQFKVAYAIYIATYDLKECQFLNPEFCSSLSDAHQRMHHESKCDIPFPLLLNGVLDSNVSTSSWVINHTESNSANWSQICYFTIKAVIMCLRLNCGLRSWHSTWISSNKHDSNRMWASRHGWGEDTTMVRKNKGDSCPQIVAIFRFKGQIIVAKGRRVTILSEFSTPP